MLFNRNKARPASGKSISNRVTTWYSVFFILLSILLLSGIYLVSDYYITHAAKKQLEAAVIDSLGDYAEGDFEANDNGVYLSRYNTSGQLIEGAMPIPITAVFTHAKSSETVAGGVRYLYYDLYDSQHKLWFRGVLSVQQNDRITTNLLYIMMISLPIAIILVLGGGYWIIKKALKPIQTMSETTQQIAQNLDLSQRVNIGQGDTELDQLAQAFNHMLDKVENSYERERQFTSDVSHEIRTPIAVIQSEVEYAQSLAQESEDLDQSLSVISRQAKQMAKLITALLDMTRIEHQEEIQALPINMTELLYEQAENYQLICELNHKDFHLDIASALSILGDAQLIKRLVDNLLANAVKFSHKTIWFSAKGHEGGLLLTVANDGPPISEEQLDKIWDRMYQGDKSRHHKGLGLGLSFVKRIAVLHKAEISVDSRADKTCFSVFFPSSS